MLIWVGHVPVRREIRDLKNAFPDQWSLYLLGLRAFHDTDQTDPLSAYQICGLIVHYANIQMETDSVLGIHGRPFKAWQDAQGIPGKEGGYCPHQNGLFLAWHRPYLALYEVGISYVFDLPLLLKLATLLMRVLTYQ